MIFVTRQPPWSDPELAARWTAWNERAVAATRALCDRVANGQSPKIDEKIYKDAKEFLLALTKNKCAYCESAILTTHPGEVEHYRPKAGIRDAGGNRVVLKVGEEEVEHPGYWWLAYDWANLLPSCIDCNRLRKHDGEGAGKGERFPVRGFRATSPGEEAQERPLLLNPTLDEPSEHLEFLDDGKIKPKTEIGEESCKLLGLNIREALVCARAASFTEVTSALVSFLTHMTDAARGMVARTPLELSLRRKLNDMWNGSTPYGACASAALHRAIDTMAQRGFPVKFPLDVWS